MSRPDPTILFIVNPNAGNGSTGKNWPLIKELATAKLGRIDYSFTKGPDYARQICKEAVEGGRRLVVCVGGDGTLNEVVNGFMEARTDAARRPPIGFIPNGTGCDIVKTIKIPKNISAAIDILAQGHCVNIDLGKLEFRDHENRKQVRYFHNVASFGLGGEVARRVNMSSKKAGPFLSFLWSTLATLLFHKKSHVRLRIDDHEPIDVTSWHVAISNGRFHGGGMHVAPDASVTDTSFNVTVIGNIPLFKAFYHIPKLYNGKIYRVPNVFSYPCRKISAFSEAVVPIEADGEPIGNLPLSASILPGTLRLITGK